jgi:uncharacterized OB-fold protein
MEEEDLQAPLEIPDAMCITYKYSFGGISRFFREIRDHGRLMGTRCERCDFVYLPPRLHCSRCYGETSWVPAGSAGTIKSCTTVHYAASSFQRNTPYICAYIQIDGADTRLLHNVMADPLTVGTGTRVKAVFKDRESRVGNISDFHFIPEPPAP